VGVKISLSHYGRNVLQMEGVRVQGCKGEEVPGACRKLRNLEFDSSFDVLFTVYHYVSQ
jgi:hypothetical protein